MKHGDTDDYMDVIGRATHSYMEVGDRVTPGAVAEDAKAEDTKE